MLQFDQILRLYCGDKAKALELVEEENYRGCKIWTFKRRVQRFRLAKEHPTYFKLVEERRNNPQKSFSWNDIPVEEKETYVDEFYMGLTNFNLEFEDEAELNLRGITREEAKYRVQGQIDQQYAEQNSTTDIM